MSKVRADANGVHLFCLQGSFKFEKNTIAKKKSRVRPAVYSFKGSTAFVVGVLTLIPIHGAPPRWGIHSYP